MPTGEGRLRRRGASLTKPAEGEARGCPHRRLMLRFLGKPWSVPYFWPRVLASEKSLEMPAQRFRERHGPAAVEGHLHDRDAGPRAQFVAVAGFALEFE